MAVQAADTQPAQPAAAVATGDRPPPPPLVTTPAPPAPPDNPQNDDERRQVARYEQWMVQQEVAINEQLKYYETEITKLRKQRKSLNSKQRVLRKSGNELGTTDAAGLERVSTEASGLQKSLETIRRQSRQHTMIVNEKAAERIRSVTSNSRGP